MRASSLREQLCDEEAPAACEGAEELKEGATCAEVEETACAATLAPAPTAEPLCAFPFSESSPCVYVSLSPAAAERAAIKAGKLSVVVSKTDSPSEKTDPTRLEGLNDETHDDQQQRNLKARALRKPRALSVFFSPLQNLTLLEFDVETYGEDWFPTEKRHFALCVLVHLLWFFAMLLRVTEFDGKLHIPGSFFWMRQAAMLGAMCAVFALSGLLSVTTDFNPGYTRKICHLALFASSPVTMFLWPYRSSNAADARLVTLWTVWTQFLPYYALAKPIRRRLTVALLAFRAIDREEDRPHTLEWLVSQAVAGLAAIVGIMIFLSYSISENKSEDKAVRMMLVMIPIIINGVGDGLAEPVGIRFGKHKYRTRALWYQGRCCSGSFTRSFEGSSCVFISGVLAVGMFRFFYSDTQFAVAMASIPLCLTLAEAFSPHTWDTPFIISVGGVILGLIERLLPGCGAQCVNQISFFGIH